MTFASIVIQFLNGLAGASSLFLVAAGLSLIFGVTRIVNFAHGSFYMLGVYLAYSLVETFGRSYLGFWGGVLLAAALVGAIGAAVEILLLRRIYRAPELFQLLGTFGLVLVIKDVVLYFWGPEDLLGPRAPGLRGAVTVLGKSFPEYDIVLIACGPIVLALLWLLMARTRWGTLVRAATQDREMVGALGVNQAWLFTGVFALGSFLAGLGGAIQVPREPAQLFLDITVIADAFVVVVVGGMGSIPGAFLAAFIIGQIKAFCIGIGDVSVLGFGVSFSKLTLVVEFLVMAAVLVVRPWGLLGREQAQPRASGEAEAPLQPFGPSGRAVALAVLALLALLPLAADAYTLVLLIDVYTAALFAVSLHLLMGPGGVVSFGHAAYFGLGAYGAALLFKHLALPMEAALALSPVVAGAGALLFGWFCVRLSGVYLAMLTLAFAQIAWSVVYQWDSVTGGSNGMPGITRASWLAGSVAYYYLAFAITAAGIFALWRAVHAPFGYALRAGRDSPLRAEAIGIDVKRTQWLAFALAGAFAGVAGGVFVFAKGVADAQYLEIPKSVDGLVMILMGGVQTLLGPVVGAVTFTWLFDAIRRATEFYRSFFGLVILVLVLVFPAGIVGSLAALRSRGKASP
ncbi:MAG: ABC transporter permease [Alphaproteobacteria bacterium]|nr:ABC transporter permease [Alphaproteobacteria bacterium]